MASEPADFDVLMREWSALPAGDRKAILALLPPERRRELQRPDISPEGTHPGKAMPAHRFRKYSPWLAGLIEACEVASPAATGLKPKVRAALTEGHAKAAAQEKPEPGPLSAPDLLRAALRRARALL